MGFFSTPFLQFSHKLGSCLITQLWNESVLQFVKVIFFGFSLFCLRKQTKSKKHVALSSFKMCVTTFRPAAHTGAKQKFTPQNAVFSNLLLKRSVFSLGSATIRDLTDCSFLRSKVKLHKIQETACCLGAWWIDRIWKGNNYTNGFSRVHEKAVSFSDIFVVKRLKLKHIDCFIERRKRQYSRLTTSVCGEVIKNF